MPPSKKITKNVTCTVGATRGPGLVELIGPACMVYVTEASTVEPGTEVAPGRKLLVDYRYELEMFGDNRGVLALRVRPYGPDRADIEALERLLARLVAAGVPDPGFGVPATFMSNVFAARLAQGAVSAFSLDQELVRLLEGRGLRFPMNSWQHDVEPAVSEMEQNLSVLGVAATLPRALINQVFEKFVDTEGEQPARRHVCETIAEQANALLAHSGLPVRWCAFADLPWEEDHGPFWLLVTPSQQEGLLREKIFKPST